MGQSKIRRYDKFHHFISTTLTDRKERGNKRVRERKKRAKGTRVRKKIEVRARELRTEKLKKGLEGFFFDFWIVRF